MSIRKLFLSLILVAIWALPAASQTRLVVIRVLDGNNRAVKGVRLHATNTGVVSAPSDRNGLTWIVVRHDTQPGESIRIDVMNGPGQSWVLMNPPDDVITVRSFQATETNVVPITVISRRDPQVLINGQLLYSSVRRMLRNLGPSSVAQYLTPDQTRAVLATEARRLGFRQADLARALHDWSATTRDPLQKATAALYEQRFHDATALLTPLFERQVTNTFELATELGLALYREGAYPDAASKYELATTLRPDDFKAASDLGLIRICLGQYAEAARLLNLSLDLMRHKLDPNDPEIASTLTNTAWLLETLHKFTDAQKANDQAFAILKRHFDNDSPEMISMYNSYGALSQEQGNYKRAKQYYSKALLIVQAKRPLSSDHLLVLINFAAAERDNGELTRSEEHFRVARRLTDQLLRAGTVLPNHPIIGQLHNEYYGVLMKSQRFDDAEREITQARDIWANSLGECHPEFAIALANLASVYQKTRRADLA